MIASPRHEAYSKVLAEQGGSLTEKGWGLAAISKVCTLLFSWMCVSIEDWVKGGGRDKRRWVMG